MPRTRAKNPARQQKPPADSATPKYSITVAADLSGVSPQQLRRMEESALLAPNRTSGNTRRYSDDDLAQIAQIAALADAGVNPEGIRQILTYRQQLVSLHTENAALRQRLDDATTPPATTPPASDASPSPDPSH